MKINRLLLASLICGLASLFYLYEFSLQVSPSVMSNELMKAFATDAVGVGLISSIFYLSYTPVQIFGGVSYDYFGPRIVMSIAVFICALGALVFAIAHNITIALAGRFLMGIGSACSFTGSLLLISRWFPQNYFAFVSALVQFMCSIGAMVGQIPLAYLADHFGWEKSMLGFAAAGFVLCVLFILFLRDFAPWQQSYQRRRAWSHPLKGLKDVLSNSQTWYLAIYGFCSWAPMVVFAALWGISYLSAEYHITIQKASLALAMIWLGLGITSPIIGGLSDRLGRRCILLIAVKIIGLISMCFLLYGKNIPFTLTLVFLFFIGSSAAGQALSFAVVNDINRRESVGTAIGFNNMALVVGGLILQPLASWLIHFFWDGATANGVPVYSLHAYKNAMFILPLTYLLAIIMSIFFIKETYCKQEYPLISGGDPNDNQQQAISAISH